MKHLFSILPTTLATVAFIPVAASATTLEDQVADYLEKFPYQDTYNYSTIYTGQDPSKLNIWVLGQEPVLVKAGDDDVVRMNNDTYYKMAFVYLGDGPVRLNSNLSSEERFSSFQIMDDRNVNFKNVIRPKGEYVLYRGTAPSDASGTLIEAPSDLVVAIVRVEVKDKNDPADTEAAQKIFKGITVSGPQATEYPHLDLLSNFPEDVAQEAEKRMAETAASVPFVELVAGPGDVPDKVSHLELAAGTKCCWGGPVTSHSSYQTMFKDVEGEDMRGANGSYMITTTAPPVDAFWSLTAYDTDRGGFFHPNADDRYHINNTGAVKNEDGSYTFNFKMACEEKDVNCLEVPEGKFDIAARYYLPSEAIQSGEWTMPLSALEK